MDKDILLYGALAVGAFLILNKTSVAVFGSPLLENQQTPVNTQYSPSAKVGTPFNLGLLAPFPFNLLAF